MNEYIELNEYSEDNKDELNEIKYILNKKSDDPNEKIKYAYKLKENQKNIDHINNKILIIKEKIKKKKKLKS